MESNGQSKPEPYAPEPMKTHTPGPWLATPTTGNPHNPNSLRMDIVTTTGEWTPAFVAGDILPEDARLIAFAPDLLAALENLRNSIRHGSTCRAPQAFPCSCDADQLWQMSGAIISKAKGKL